MTQDPAPTSTWRVRYDDHSGNRYRFWSSDDAATGHYTYDPVTPEQSSSGSYSGGEPQQGLLEAPGAAALLQAVRDLESAEKAHARTRMMGTGSFAISEGDGAERRFLIRRGSRLRRFDELVAPYRCSS